MLPQWNGMDTEKWIKAFAECSDEDRIMACVEDNSCMTMLVELALHAVAAEKTIEQVTKMRNEIKADLYEKLVQRDRSDADLERMRVVCLAEAGLLEAECQPLCDAPMSRFQHTLHVMHEAASSLRTVAAKPEMDKG